MDSKSVFNATICIIGVSLLLIHIVNLVLKKKKRRDEMFLLVFFIFTAIHFATYTVYDLVKFYYTSNTYIMSFYTTFYIMNNAEVFLFFLYLSNYIRLPKKYKNIFSIVNISLFTIFVVTDFINIATHMYFTSVDGVYQRAILMFISQGYQFVMLVISFILAITNKELSVREKIAFSIYCFIPFIAIIVQNALPGFAIAYLSMILAIEILILFLSIEKNYMLLEDEQRLKDANVKIMVSQIQPHFIYNTLSSISTLIPLDQARAQKALDDFTEYLRMNFSTLTETNLVSFSDELKHIQTYIELEKMRFNERLHVNYDIKVSSFNVPPLSIQPLVENAIKHGILKKVESGTLLIKTYETENSYVVEVIDDGVGFNIHDIDFKSNNHIGLNNVKHRITSMCKGEMNIFSEINKGTTIVVKFYK